MKLLLLLAMAVLLAGCDPKPGVPLPPKQILTTNPMLTPRDSLVYTAVGEYIYQRSVACLSVALVEGGQVYTYHYGEIDMETGIMPTGQTLYEVGSITQTLTATAMLMWLEEKGLDLQTPVKSYLPATISSNMSRNGTDIRFAHLLSHTSGLPRLPDDLGPKYDPYWAYDTTRIYSYLTTHGPLRTPGTAPTTEQQADEFYGNLAYALAGALLERQTQKPYEQLLKDYLLTPCQMTGATTADLHYHPLRARPHNSEGGEIVNWHFFGFAPTGGLKASITDMAAWVQAQLAATDATAMGRAMRLARTPVVVLGGKDYFGYGWEYYYTEQGTRLITKDGATGGYRAFMALDPDGQRGMVILCNNNSASGSIIPILNLLEGFFQ